MRQAKRLSDGDNKWRLIISDFDLYKQPEQVPLPENTNQSYLKAYLPPEVSNATICAVCVCVCVCCGANRAWTTDAEQGQLQLQR